MPTLLIEQNVQVTAINLVSHKFRMQQKHIIWIEIKTVKNLHCLKYYYRHFLFSFHWPFTGNYSGLGWVTREPLVIAWAAFLQARPSDAIPIAQ